MKKIIRILLFVIVILVGYQHFSFADIIVPPTAAELLVGPGSILLCLLFSIILIVISISFICKKYFLKKPVKEKRFIYSFCICVIIILISFSFSYSDIMSPSDRATHLLLSAAYVLIIILVLSLLIDRKSQKISKPIRLLTLSCSIVILVTTIFLSINSINYNRRFLKHITESRYHLKVENPEEFINEIIENNTGRRKVSITYGSNTYSTSDELKKLTNNISKLTASKMFYLPKIDYDKTGFYIKNIEISEELYNSAIEAFNANFLTYYGNLSGSQVKKLISYLEENSITYVDEPYKVPSVKYSVGSEKIDVIFDPINKSEPDSYMQGLTQINDKIIVKKFYWISSELGDSNLVNTITIGEKDATER